MQWQQHQLHDQQRPPPLLQQQPPPLMQQHQQQQQQQEQQHQQQHQEQQQQQQQPELLVHLPPRGQRYFSLVYDILSFCVRRGVAPQHTWPRDRRQYVFAAARMRVSGLATCCFDCEQRFRVRSHCGIAMGAACDRLPHPVGQPPHPCGRIPSVRTMLRAGLRGVCQQLQAAEGA